MIREKRRSKPVLWIVIPCYNEQEVLPITAPEFRNKIEQLAMAGKISRDSRVLFVNDGSKDSSGKLCEEYDSKYPNVFAYHQENAGSSAARNEGIRHATGDYIGFCDSDDYVEKDMYESLLSAAKDNPDGKIYQIMTCYETQSGEVLLGPVADSEEVKVIPSAEMFRLLMLHKGTWLSALTSTCFSSSPQSSAALPASLTLNSYTQNVSLLWLISSSTEYVPIILPAEIIPTLSQSCSISLIM